MLLAVCQSVLLIRPSTDIISTYIENCKCKLLYDRFMVMKAVFVVFHISDFKIPVT